MYLTGVGAVTFGWSATIGGEPVGKISLRPVPLLAGVYEARIAIPSDLASGDYPLVFTVNGVGSREAIAASARARHSA